MANYRIGAVRTERTDDDPHEHITRVRFYSSTSGDGISRATVIANLKNPNGDRYYTWADEKYADVIYRECPYCDFSEYITTTPDTTTKNNLLSLPRF